MEYLVHALATRHDVAAIYLRERAELPMDDDLRASLARVEEVQCPRRLSLATRLVRRTAALRGIPAWASFVDVPEFAHRAHEVTQAWRPDIVHFEYHVMGQYARSLPDRRAARILTEYEAGVLAAREHIATGKDGGALQASLQRQAWRRYERRIIGDMDAVVVFAERDREALAPLAGKTPVVRIGIGTRLPAAPLDPLGTAGHPRLLFIGNFMHPPNVDAAIRLTDRIFPAVRARVPGTMLRIVGAQPPPELLARAREAIDVTGRVPDVVPWLNAAALVVVPLRVGGGMRVKVLEALAHGKAVVASPRALDGLTVNDGVDVAVADSDEEFVTRIVSLLQSPNARGAMARNAREWACNNLDHERWAAEYEALYDRLRPVAPTP